MEKKIILFLFSFRENQLNRNRVCTSINSERNFSSYFTRTHASYCIVSCSILTHPLGFDFRFWQLGNSERFSSLYISQNTTMRFKIFWFFLFNNFVAIYFHKNFAFQLFNFFATFRLIYKWNFKKWRRNKIFNVQKMIHTKQNANDLDRFFRFFQLNLLYFFAVIRSLYFATVLCAIFFVYCCCVVTKERQNKKTFATRKITFTSDCFQQNVCIWQQAQCFYMDKYNDVINRYKHTEATPFRFFWALNQPHTHTERSPHIILACSLYIVRSFDLRSVCLSIAAISSVNSSSGNACRCVCLHRRQLRIFKKKNKAK